MWRSSFLAKKLKKARCCMGKELLYWSFLLEFPLQKTHYSFLFLLLALYCLLPLRWYSFLRVCWFQYQLHRIQDLKRFPHLQSLVHAGSWTLFYLNWLHYFRTGVQFLIFQLDANFNWLPVIAAFLLNVFTKYFIQKYSFF